MEVQILAVPYDTARRDWRCGAGPQGLLDAGLAAHLEARGYRVSGVETIEDDDDLAPAEIRTAFALMRRLAAAVRAARRARRFPLVLAGNCNAAVGVLAGLAPELDRVYWFDAHGESNTPESTASGFLDGMGLAMAFGWCWRNLTASIPGFRPLAPEDTFLIGARDLDPPEAALLDGSGIRRVDVSDTPDWARRLGAIRAAAGLSYLHVDLDVLDPDAVGHANDHPAPGGLTAEQLGSAVAAIRRATSLGALTIASYAPESDRTQAVLRAALGVLDAALDPV
jgi:arginase